MMIAQDHIDGRAVALYAIGPPVVTQKRVILVDQVAEPGQHDAHVVERHSLHILLLLRMHGSSASKVAPEATVSLLSLHSLRAANPPYAMVLTPRATRQRPCRPESIVRSDEP